MKNASSVSREREQISHAGHPAAKAFLRKLGEKHPVEARVVEMHFLRKLTLPEISKVTGLSIGVVRHRWSKGRLWLQKGLGAQSTRERLQAAESVPTVTVENDLVGNTAQSSVIQRTVEVIGDEAEAMRWLGTPIRALDYATPVSLLHKPKGREAILTVLGRLEHGVF